MVADLLLYVCENTLTQNSKTRSRRNTFFMLQEFVTYFDVTGYTDKKGICSVPGKTKPTKNTCLSTY
jgi:hypothetical protein